MSAKIRALPQARDQLGEADDWWRANREKTPDLVAEEWAQALALLAEQPKAGRQFPLPHHRYLRVLLMPRTRYHIYSIRSGSGPSRPGGGIDRVDLSMRSVGRMLTTIAMLALGSCWLPDPDYDDPELRLKAYSELPGLVFCIPWDPEIDKRQGRKLGPAPKPLPRAPSVPEPRDRRAVYAA